MKLIHTADWHIGKPFLNYGDRDSVLRQARLNAIEAIAAAAAAYEVRHVLVAGDVYDTDQPGNQMMLEPIERMRRADGVTWHLIPGNHDPHRPKAVWDRLMDAGLPANVILHLEPGPVLLDADHVARGESGVMLLPAPLTRKAGSVDPTAWMDAAATPDGMRRVGLAHGSITDFSTEGVGFNRIDPARPTQAGLDYLALGDWHGTKRIGPRCWYAGTPEPDAPGSQTMGQALLVEIGGAGETPAVTPLPTGTYQWHSIERSVETEQDADDMDAAIRLLEHPARTVIHLTLQGSPSLATGQHLRRLTERLRAALLHLDVSDQALTLRPTDDDLALMSLRGVLGVVAQKLRAASLDPDSTDATRRVATDALVQLYMRAERTGQRQESQGAQRFPRRQAEPVFTLDGLAPMAAPMADQPSPARAPVSLFKPIEFEESGASL